jgi:hypothetical protein
MAGPLNGIGGQQYPFATSFQPGQQQGAPVRPQNDDKTPKPNQVQPPNTQAAQSKNSDTRNSRDLSGLLKDAEATDRKDRGSVVDITV